MARRFKFVCKKRKSDEIDAGEGRVRMFNPVRRHDSGFDKLHSNPIRIKVEASPRLAAAPTSLLLRVLRRSAVDVNYFRVLFLLAPGTSPRLLVASSATSRNDSHARNEAKLIEIISDSRINFMQMMLAHLRVATN
jgi:hypothetical protein